MEGQPKEKNIITILNNILIQSDYVQAVYESSARILSVLLSDLSQNDYHNEQLDFFRNLLTLTQFNLNFFFY